MADLSQYADIDIINIVSSDAEAELKKRGYDYGWYKIEPYVGSIYILVNPAFPNLVKLGYADDVLKRLRSLNSNSGLPDPYHCYAIYKVKKRLEDLKLHGLIDSLDKTLRHVKNREFYEMDAEKAYSVLSAIAQISGDEEQLIKNPFNDDYFTKNQKVNNQGTLSNIGLIADSRDLKDKKNKGFSNAVQKNKIPNGIYYFERKKKSEDRLLQAVASIKDGVWTLLKDSDISVVESPGCNNVSLKLRAMFALDAYNKLLNDTVLGKSSPSTVSSAILYGAVDGWTVWRDSNGEYISKYKD